jgi:hypothetical protein
LQTGAGTDASDWPFVSAAHDAAPQVVPTAATWQPAFPSQKPVFPQLLAAPAGHIVLMRGAPPRAMLVQVPTRLATVQLWHPLAQATLQQTPSVQFPLVQSLAALHCIPFDSLVPQRFFTHVKPPVHWLSRVQVVKHDGLVALHVYGSHGEVATAGQLPLPSQLAAGVNVAPMQLAFRHPVLVDHGRHAPAPLHVPSLPQLPIVGVVAVQRPFGSGLPDPTNEHVPTRPETRQL